MKNWHGMLFMFAMGLSLSEAISSLPVLAEDKGHPGQVGEVQERGLLRTSVAPPPYACGSGVCLCVGQANCDQLTQPTPCKRQKFCVGQTASSPPPLPPQEPLPSAKQPMQSTARTTSGNFVICSCRSGP